MENEKQITEQESFEIIQRMIQTAKSDIRDNGFQYLLWGWLVFIAALSHYALHQLQYKYESIPWLLMPVGGIISFFYGMSERKKQKVQTYVDEFLRYVLIAFIITLSITLGFMFKLSINTYPVIMILYGILLFVSGGVIRFKPLVAGGIINWVCAVLAFFATFEQQLLIIAFAVLLGYIIPGYLLKRKFHEQENAIA